MKKLLSSFLVILSLVGCATQAEAKEPLPDGIYDLISIKSRLLHLCVEEGKLSPQTGGAWLGSMARRLAKYEVDMDRLNANMAEVSRLDTAVTTKTCNTLAMELETFR